MVEKRMTRMNSSFLYLSLFFDVQEGRRTEEMREREGGRERGMK